MSPYSNVKKRKVEVHFSGESVTSDAGLLLLKEVDKELGLTSNIAKKCMTDPRDQRFVKHSLETMLKQRVYGLSMGYEDLNDHENLRHDPCWQAAAGEVEALSGDSTLCRFEHFADRKTAVAIHKELVEQFIRSFKIPPKELILDFDATDDTVHGNQIGKFFHGYYRSYCFLPLYVTCGKKLLVSYLRPSSKDPALHAGAILKLLATRLRAEWPDVSIVFRADGGFCRPRILSWCERNDVKYVVGLGGNARNKALVEDLRKNLELEYQTSGEKQKEFTRIRYGAKSWGCERDVVVKVEVGPKGSNVRFVVTNIKEEADHIYTKIYSLRGDMENRIKEMQLGLFSDRTSAHEWHPNQFRLLLSALAYTLMNAVREKLLQGTELAKAQVNTIRLKLLKIGATIIRNTRRIKFILPKSHPYQDLFNLAASRLSCT
ncbi:MAG: IS1380 family transposase [Flavobacteriia bacterium]|nr:IS1380 family transposase [Flavobacteriia bacterium]